MSFRRNRNVELSPGLNSCNENYFVKVNSFRKQQGLPDLKAKKRNCLKCDAVFLSDHAGVRMCPKHGGIREAVQESKVIFG